MSDFIDRLKRFKFKDDERDIYAHCEKFAQNLAQNKTKEIEIYLGSAFEFYVAFFGAMMANAVPYVLPKPIFSGLMPAVCDDNFSDFMCDAKEECELNLNGDAKFFLQTSGSSGASKNIEKSLDQMITESRFLARELGFGEHNIFFSSVSHQHMFGLTFKVFLPIALGAEVVARELNYPEIILDLELKDHIFITSPVLLQTLVQNPRIGNLKPLGGIISAGSKLRGELRHELSAIFDGGITEIYGSTETGVVARDNGGGLRLFGVVKAALNENEALNVSSPWCEFFQTNDWAEICGDELNLKGRIDRIIKLNDKRVSLESIENRLMRSGILRDCYCGLHPKFKRAAALLELNENGIKKFRQSGKKGVVSELNELLKDEFKNNIRYFKIVQKIPKNAQGKTLKSDFESAFCTKNEPEWSYERCEQGHKFSSILGAHLEIFSYHFPNLPLLAGFMQLDFVFKLAKSVGIDVAAANKIENLKFIKFVRPNDKLDVCFYEKDGKLYFEIFCNGLKSSSGRINLG